MLYLQRNASIQCIQIFNATNHTAQMHKVDHGKHEATESRHYNIIQCRYCVQRRRNANVNIDISITQQSTAVNNTHTVHSCTGVAQNRANGRR